MQEVSAAGQGGSIDAELIAVNVAVTEGEPRVLTIDDGSGLPSGRDLDQDETWTRMGETWSKMGRPWSRMGHANIIRTFTVRSLIGRSLMGAEKT